MNYNIPMRTIRTALLIGLAAAVISLARAEDNPAIKKDMAQLQGEWSMMSGSADGQPMPDEMLKQMKRVCKGDETTTTMGGQIFMKAKITIDPPKKPKTIDYQMTDGFTKGKKQVGIYEVEANGKPAARFAVNLFDRDESDVRLRTRQDDKTGLKTVESVSIGYVDVAARAPSSPVRKELWTWLLLVVLAVLMLEWYIYNRRVYV